MKKVRHLPKLARNLVSVGQFSDIGCAVTFNADSWKITKGNLVIARRKRDGTLYITSTHDDFPGSINMASSENDAGLSFMPLYGIGGLAT